MALEGIPTAVVWNTGLRWPLTPPLVGGHCWGLTGPPQPDAGLMGTRKRSVNWASRQALCWALGNHLKIPHTPSRYRPCVYRGPEATWLARGNRQWVAGWAAPGSPSLSTAGGGGSCPRGSWSPASP